MRLKEDLEGSVSDALRIRRPLLTHLNADTSWVLSLPYPMGSPRPLGRNLFNILIDPWLQGPQTDYFSWFSRQWHVVPSSVQTIGELNTILGAVEAIMESRHTNTSAPVLDKGATANYIDLVLVSHEFTDHCNRQTLQDLDKSIPVLATKAAARLISSWRHFHHVQPIVSLPRQQTDWTNPSQHGAPSWLSVWRIVSNKDALYFHSAILIRFDIGPNAVGGTTEGVVYTPHGIIADDLKSLSVASPPISVLALLHGLHDIRISTRQLNLGAHNALRARRISGSKYWVSTRECSQKVERH